MNPLQLWIRVVIVVPYSTLLATGFFYHADQTDEGTAEAPDHLIKSVLLEILLLSVCEGRIRQ
jgi:hypothetical protein